MAIETATLTEADIAVGDEGWLYESPLWDHRRGLFVWVDIEAGHVHTLEPRSGDRNSHDVGQPIACVALRASGGYVAALQRSIATLTPAFELADEVAAPRGLADDIRFNDGAVAPDGAFWAGTLSHDRGGAGALYRIGADHVITTVIEGVSISNGMDWSLDGRDHFYVDSGTGTVELLRVSHEPVSQSWSVVDRQTVLDLSRDSASPDGLTVDSTGDIWVALWGGGRVVRMSPEGVVTAQVVVPAPHVSSVTFGGDDLRDLYITTARESLSLRQLAEHPLSGSVFRRRTRVAGLPARAWAG